MVFVDPFTKRFNKFPSLGFLDAMLNGKFLTFLGVKVIFGMGVAGKDNIITFEIIYLFEYIRYNGLCFLCPK